MACNCGCNHTANTLNTFSNCETCEPNAANINLLKCAGYGFDNRCNCACPPSPRTSNPIATPFGVDCVNTVQPVHAGTFNPYDQLAKRASRCVVDHIADCVDKQIECSRTQFTNQCVDDALGIRTAIEPLAEAAHKNICYKPCCKCHTNCDCDTLIRQTVQAVANDMSEELFAAVECINAKYQALIDNLVLPTTATVLVNGNGVAPTSNACIVNTNTGCGACPTAGNSTNATTWGRCN